MKWEVFLCYAWPWGVAIAECTCVGCTGLQEMKALLDNEGIRQWVLQNLVVKDGHASWRLNIEGMTRHFDNVLQ